MSDTMIRPNPNQQAGKKRPASIAAFTFAMAALLLVACGGGGSEGSTASSGGGTAGSGTVTPAKVTLPQVLQDPAYTPVVDTTYLSVASSAAQASKAAAAASPAPTITPTELLNWAEAMFPQRFPAGPQNQTQGALTFRYYPGNDSYVGIANNVIYAFGADTANRLVNAGNLSDFNCTVKPGSCTVIPVQAFTCDTAAVTCVEVVSTASATQGSLPVTFGQPFKAGDWKHATQGLIAKVDGIQIPLQSDEISSHRDGSARFAVLSAQLNNMAAGQTKIINLYTGAKTTSTPNVPSNPDWKLEIEAQLYDASGNATETLIAQPQAQLATQIANGTDRRLAGAVASEYTVALPLRNKTTGAEHPHLTARLHTRLVDAGARIRTDMVIENTRTWTQAPGNITYSLSVKRNGSTLLTQPKFTHYHHARWHKVLWTGSSAEPQARVRHYMPYFMASKAVWNYDLSLTVPEAAISGQYSLLNQRRTEQAALGPMANLLLTAYFPTTGGRGEIGPYPRWTAMYLLSQDPHMLETMLAIADASASVPVHYRDDETQLAIDLERYPKVSTRVGPSDPALPTVVNGTTIWTPDVSHQASFAYVPYLVTGDAFYLDELQFWASWTLAAPNPGYRDYGSGLMKSEQIRGRAWGVRVIGEAARATPDSHPHKTYFVSRLQKNLDWFSQSYVAGSTVSGLTPIGMLPQPDWPDRTSPWQNDFVTTVFSQLAENNEVGASSFLNFITRFTVGRFNKQSEGYCIAYAPAYDVFILDANGQYISDWNQLFQKNWPSVTCSSSLQIMGSPSSATGYAANARGMLGAAANAGITTAASAYQTWRQMTSTMDAALASDPTWAIVPR